MGSYSWAKVWIEVLDDPKMGRLSDSLWRRTIELILFAKDTDKDGYLPPLEDMAWRLRTNAELLEAELTDLAKIGIVERRNGGWFVTNFEKRQEAATAAERMARYRERKRKQEYYGDETDKLPSGYEPVTKRNTDKIREEEDKIREDRARPSDNGQNIFSETGSKYLVEWWVKQTGGSIPADARVARSKLYDPADTLLERLDHDIPRAKDLLIQERNRMLQEDKTPKWLEAMVPYVLGYLDRPSAAAASDTWGSDILIME